jgi:hypothetical protein
MAVALTKNDMVSLAKAKGGYFLSAKYTNKRAKYLWQCDKGHQWEATGGTIRSGSWCRKCWDKSEAGKYLKIDGISEGKAIAHSMGGALLSAEYVNSATPMEWRCIAGHTWNAALAGVKKGGWCPRCNNSHVKERYCRRLMSAMFGVPFEKARPHWLINERGNRCEFDGYSPELNIAFEYHGEYHYQFSKHFHQNEESLEQRKRDDEFKRQLARKHGVFLVEVPYTVSPQEMQDWILLDLETQGYSEDAKKVDANAIARVIDDSPLLKLHEQAAKMGGKCLSDFYVGSEEKYKFECDRGHQWEATFANVLSGTWCPGCKGSRISKSKIDPFGLEKLKLLAESRGGSLVSETYQGVNFKHSWKCSKNHEWKACPADVKRGSWCKICRRSGNARQTTDATSNAVCTP